MTAPMSWTKAEAREFFMQAIRKAAKEQGWRPSELAMRIANANREFENIWRKLQRQKRKGTL